MKTLPLTFLILLPIYLNAQSFWSVVDDDKTHNKSHVTDKGLFQDSIILVSGFISDASCPHHNLFAFNRKGQKLWNIGGYHDVILTDSSYIYTAGFTPLDDIANVGQIVISKFNKQGNKIFSIGYPERPPYVFFYFVPVNMDISNDGTILVSSKKSVVKSDIQGARIQEYKLKMPSDIKSVVSMNPKTYLITTRNRLYKSDSSFVLMDSVAVNSNLIKTIIHRDTIYALSDYTLIRFDPELNSIDTIITHSTTGFQNMEFYEENLWFQTNDAESVSLIKLKNKEILDTLTFDVPANIKGFIVSKNNYSFIGNSFSNQISVCNYSNPGFTEIKPLLPDIEIVDFDIDSISLNYVNYPESTFARGYYFNATISVKNNGKDTIDTFAGFSDLDGGVNCVQNYFYRKFVDSEINPGQTVSFKLKRLYEEGVNNNQLCFECLAPNSKLESKTGNNSLCKTFDITGLSDKNQSDIKIYPNPASDNIFIDHPGTDSNHVELFDMNGNMVFNNNFTGQRLKIDLYDLKPGLYIVKIISKNRLDKKMIVKR